MADGIAVGYPVLRRSWDTPAMRVNEGLDTRRILPIIRPVFKSNQRIQAVGRLPSAVAAFNAITMIELETFLPAFNTSLILISGACLLVGFSFIRRRQIRYHHRTMITATVFAALFLIVYLLRAWLLGSTPFRGTGWVRTLYLAILFSHMVLATAVAPLALITLYRAWRGDFQRHRRIARITLPIWLYVVITGWVVYWMLYKLY